MENIVLHIVAHIYASLATFTASPASQASPHPANPIHHPSPSAVFDNTLRTKEVVPHHSSSFAGEFVFTKNKFVFSINILEKLKQLLKVASDGFK